MTVTNLLFFILKVICIAFGVAVTTFIIIFIALLIKYAIKEMKK